ncbi:FAD-dependent oxidoreductase [Tissierella sp. Yu-01]|uniref:FAD-dependent oxidoreductase n=1 Tax=Tissierella sp. Yu-01 TaxID=3035694 RepID=UPI00240E51A6|nr:FAD-dependent oxidoreductase [Tissierella sp. Yu-01]WFA09050.1 FAD-dependent oxidoreductase [Tissierella sp. Yu-01]
MDIRLNNETIYDLLIIGGGPAGLNAALYAKRKGVNVGIIAKDLGGQVMDTSTVENYLGFPTITGMGLIEEFKKHVKELNVPIEDFITVESVRTSEKSPIKEILTDNGNTYKSKAIIIATGSKPRKLGVLGEAEYSGKGVSYCAICDGPLFAEEDLIVAGGGNSAVEAAIDLSKIANKVTLVHRSQFRADKILLDQLDKLSNVEVKLNTQIQEIVGEKMMLGINVLDKENDSSYTISAAGIFVEIGYLPNSDAFKDLIQLNQRGEIVVNNYGETNVKGIFAAGDVTESPYKQIVISAAEGARAALAANDYLNTLEDYEI